MNYTLMRRAKEHAATLRERQREYEEMCEQDRRDGFRPRCCIHGASNWTDYDNICGACEDGYGSYEGLVLYRLALDWAHRDWRQATERNEALMVILRLGGFSDTLRSELIDWALEPITGKDPR